MTTHLPAGPYVRLADVAEAIADCQKMLREMGDMGCERISFYVHAAGTDASLWVQAASDKAGGAEDPRA